MANSVDLDKTVCTVCSDPYVPFLLYSKIVILMLIKFCDRHECQNILIVLSENLESRVLMFWFQFSNCLIKLVF